MKQRKKGGKGKGKIGKKALLKRGKSAGSAIIGGLAGKVIGPRLFLGTLAAVAFAPQGWMQTAAIGAAVGSLLGGGKEDVDTGDFVADLKANATDRAKEAGRSTLQAFHVDSLLPKVYEKSLETLSGTDVEDIDFSAVDDFIDQEALAERYAGMIESEPASSMSSNIAIHVPDSGMAGYLNPYTN